ncbi:MULTISPECIES: HAD family hydrolase [Legionella]|uniref:Phosphatase n=1 Tax=Legionella maceachernii TaxID=466 RepID=A0A0W0VWU4_9GAMM|nr:HAD-IA family hydrolase [Legionella maceachernii]KTD24520.1 phosphatase [Legionella maceachernii]SJZ61413.1 phosphoglycolate phosphatase [Legionella maceachernii]SUP00904.1 (S)-2-haloacid dehalogenase 4A [Legionella maceachernii]
MGKPYRLVVFDWEGTLGDILGQILNSVSTEARRLQFGELDEQLARQSVGLGLVLALKKAFPHLNEEQQEQLLLAVHQSLVARTTEVYLIPGAKKMAERLDNAGIHLGIASNKGQQSLQRVLHASGLDKLFKVTRSAGQAPAKPCPQMLEEIMDTYGVSAKETLMVGDSVSDIEMAKSIGVDAIGVDFYHQQEAALLAAGALAVFDDYQQLAEYLQLN